MGGLGTRLATAVVPASSPPGDAVPPYPWRQPPLIAGASAGLRESRWREGRQLGLAEGRKGGENDYYNQI